MIHLTDEEFYERLLNWRGIYRDEFNQDVVCKRCSGSGRAVYGCTSTWRHTVGGQACTEDVCDKCWGTGSENRQGANLLHMTNRIKQLERFIAENADVDSLTGADKELYEKLHKQYFPQNYR